MHWQLSLDENFVVVNTSQIKDVEFKKFVFPGGEIGFNYIRERNPLGL